MAQTFPKSDQFLFNMQTKECLPYDHMSVWGGDSSTPAPGTRAVWGQVTGGQAGGRKGEVTGEVTG